jgi:tight adherence protein B
MNIFIGVAMFITIVLFIEGCYLAFKTIRNPEREKLRRRLRAISSGEYGSEAIDIVRKRVLSEVSWFNNLLLSIPGIQGLWLMLEQADSKYSVGVFLLSSAFLASLGFLLGSFVMHNTLLGILGAPLLGMMSFLYIYRKRHQRLLKFQRQLPEALDLVARALRAGHTFPVGMKMVSDEFADPMGAEFAKTLAEINFGVGVPEALKNLARRVACPDLNFFVVSILIQRETGGNLAEIAENISRLIRQRFQLQDRIQVLAAEGKLSAIVMFALPFFLGFAISLLNPDYLKVLFTDPFGKGMLMAAAFMMVLGAVVIKKMIRIKV